ncbi:hypothetical protein BC826DRAFT_275590 [Russula brevipes]|nr:hypothetical protein BC826DRAFT_275590 [Russula brevipes]
MPARSHVFYGLNAARALSVVGLLLAFASSIVVIVADVRAVNKSQLEPDSSDGTCGYIGHSTVPNQPAGVFWAVVNRLFIIFQLVFLLLSEIEWPMAFFDRFFPVLGSQFGLGALGVFQGLIGAAILSHRVGKFTLVAAFFLFSVGCLNIVLGLIFREDAKPKRSIRAWKEGSDDGILPMHTGDSGTPKSNGFGFGNQGEKQAGLKGFLITKPTDAVPSYAPRPTSFDSSLLSVVEPNTIAPGDTKASTFRSSPTAI